MLSTIFETNFSKSSFFSFILAFPVMKSYILGFNVINYFQRARDYEWESIEVGSITSNFDFRPQLCIVIANVTEYTKKKVASRNRQARHLTESITGRKMSRRLSFFLYSSSRKDSTKLRTPTSHWCRPDWRNPTYEKNLAPPGVSAAGGFNAQVLRPSRAARLGSAWRSELQVSRGQGVPAI